MKCKCGNIRYLEIPDFLDNEINICKECGGTINTAEVIELMEKNLERIFHLSKKTSGTNKAIGNDQRGR